MSDTVPGKLQNKSKYSSVFIFFVLQRLVFQFWLWLTRRTLVCAYFGRGQKKKLYLLWCEHAFFEEKKWISIFFWPNSRFKTLVPHFFRTSKTFFSFWFWPTWWSRICVSFGCTWKKLTSCGAYMHFLKKKVLLF